MRQIQYRQPKNIIPPERILVLCEGESEIIYLNGYRSEDANRRRLSRLEIVIYQPSNYSPLGLLKEAKKKIKDAQKDKMPYKSVWIVFDKDEHANIPQALHEAQTSNPPVNTALSITCFEYWILLHFEKTSRSYNNCNGIIKDIIKKHLPEYTKTFNFYPYLKSRLGIALDNAAWLHDQNKFELENGTPVIELPAFTSFDLLIRYLDKIGN